MSDDQLKRDAIAYLKAQFLGWVNPPLRLPAESVIEDVVERIIGMACNREWRLIEKARTKAAELNNVSRERWLNGWPRNGTSVLLGSGVHCAGCGKSQGVTCVAIGEDWVSPEKDPDWPFAQAKCPLCLGERGGYVKPEETLATRLARFKEAKRLLESGSARDR